MTKKEVGLVWVFGSIFVFLVATWGGAFLHSLSEMREWWSFPLLLTQMIVMIVSLIAFAFGLQIIVNEKEREENEKRYQNIRDIVERIP